MLKQNWRLISRIERIADNFIILACFFGAYYGRASLLFWNDHFDLNIPFAGESLAPIREYVIVLFVGIVGFNATLSALGGYGSMRLSSPLRLVKISVLGSMIVFVALAAVLFMVKSDLSRAFVALFCTLVGSLLTLERIMVLKVLRYWRRRGRNFRNVIVCGIGEQAIRLAKEIAARPELGLLIRGFADLREAGDHRERSLEAFKKELRPIVRVGRVIAGQAELERALNEYAVDELIFTDVVEVMPIVEEMVLLCAERGVRTTIAADLFSIGMVKSGISYFGGMPLIHFQTPPGDSWELAVKRGFDVVVASFCLLIMAPLFGALAIAIRSTSGPVFFRQTRVGLNGRFFQMYKFRSMYVGSEGRLTELQPLNEMSGPAFKMENDPRITPVGRFIRRFSLDELPQLWNVLIGEMSLVGPRPPVPGEVSLYERRSRRRLSMRPGLTCIWQVSGRNNIKDFRSWVELDLHYIDNWSLTGDFVLLFRTIPAVLLGTGAR